MPCPHVEAAFVFDGERNTPVQSGYFPQHLLGEYLVGGRHSYDTDAPIPPGGTATGVITFIRPEAYPPCLWEGKIIKIQEGSRIVGHATITKILDPRLRKEE